MDSDLKNGTDRRFLSYFAAMAILGIHFLVARAWSWNRLMRGVHARQWNLLGCLLHDGRFPCGARRYRCRVYAGGPRPGASRGDAFPSPNNRRLFVNDGANAQVLVIDTEQQQIETRLDVGPGATHIYQPLENELWTHSDEEGAFYVIDINELTEMDKAVAAQENTAYRKLADHEQRGTTADWLDGGADLVGWDVEVRVTTWINGTYVSARYTMNVTAEDADHDLSQPQAEHRATESNFGTFLRYGAIGIAVGSIVAVVYELQQLGLRR